MAKKSYPKGMTETEWKRKHGMELLRSGMKQAHVARRMGVNRRTVYDWKKRVDDNQGFRNRKKKGRNSRLTDKQKTDLKRIVDNGVTSYGFPTDLWTLKRIAVVIEKEFGVHYNTTYIWQLLRVLGYSAQIPIAVAIEKDSEYVKRWFSEDYPKYVREAREHGATILFLDESGMQACNLSYVLHLFRSAIWDPVILDRWPRLILVFRNLGNIQYQPRQSVSMK